MKECWLYSRCNHKDCPTSEEPNKFCLRRYKLDNLYNSSLLSMSQREHKKLRVDEDGTDFEAFKKIVDIEKNIVSFVNDRRNLYLHSHNCGNGKTTSAVRLIQSYFNEIWPEASLGCRALFISVPRFLIELKDFSRDSAYINFIKENVMKADLVVWDDIAAKVGTEFELNQLLSFIDGRIALGKSNIYTSNLNATEMRMALGDRLTSRICNYSIDIQLDGADKRAILGGNE